MQHKTQQKGIVTSTPADGMVGVEPPAHMAAAPTPILPQGITTSARVQGGGGIVNVVKKTTRDKTKVQAVMSKKQTVKTSGK